MKLTIYGDPRTKKNSARILKSHSGGRFVAPSKAYVDYEATAYGKSEGRTALSLPA